MKVKQIQTEGQFDMVADRVEMLINAEPETDEARELRHLTKLIVDHVVKEVQERQNLDG